LFGFFFFFKILNFTQAGSTASCLVIIYEHAFFKKKKENPKNCKLLPNLILIITMVWNTQAHSMFFFFFPQFCDVAQVGDHP